ncbi:phage antitermination protein Q [Klebsiella pneumoniae]|nr:phage antitermination protein Q [Klebsiella pneumoniae]
MNTQYLQYVRQQLIVATADLSGATKGQLVAFAENAQFTATARSRGRKKVADPVTGRMVNPSSPPIPGQQSRAKGSSIALVLPVEYSTASWRRALLSLEEHQKAWLLWNYSDNIRWEHQETITSGHGSNSARSWLAYALRRRLSIAFVNLSGWPRRMSKPSWQGGRLMNTRRWRNWLV